MNLGNLETTAKKLVPAASDQKISSTVRRIILNDGAVEVAFFTRCLKKSKTFNMVANQQEYSISENVSDYLIIDSAPLKYNDGTNYRTLDPTTKFKLDYDIPLWRDAAVGTPREYFIEGDSIWTHPTIETSVTNGFWIDYAAKPEVMSDAGHFPFHKDGDQTTEIPHLSPLSWNVLDFWVWQANIIVSKDANVIEAKRQTFYDNLGVPDYLRKRIVLLDWRPDIEFAEETMLRSKDFRW